MRGVGFLGGLFGGVAGLSGIFPAIWTQIRGWPKDIARGVYQPFIVMAHVLTLLLIGAVSFDRKGAVLLLIAVPAVLLGVMDRVENLWPAERAALCKCWPGC